ncbi:unnamed protein product [Aphanomyces euteiches]
MLSSLRRLPSSFRRFATKSSGAAYFASPNKPEVSLAVPTKIAEIAADSNYVALTKDMVWNNPQVPTRRSEDQDDFFFPNIHEPGKYEAVQVFGHKDKTNVVAWVHLGRQLCGAKGIPHAVMASIRHVQGIVRRFATKATGTPFFSTPSKATHASFLEVPSKIEEIAANSNYVALTKDMIWNNPNFARPRSDVADDFFLPHIHEPGKYEAMQVYGHKDKTHAVAWVHFGRQLGGPKDFTHGGCIATVFDELFITTMIWTANRVGFTGTMTVNYRRLLISGSSALFYIDLEKNEGRKVILKATLQDNDGVEYSNATAVFVTPVH